MYFPTTSTSVHYGQRAQNRGKPFLFYLNEKVKSLHIFFAPYPVDAGEGGVAQGASVVNPLSTVISANHQASWA